MKKLPFILSLAGMAVLLISLSLPYFTAHDIAQSFADTNFATKHLMPVDWMASIIKKLIIATVIFFAMAEFIIVNFIYKACRGLITSRLISTVLGLILLAFLMYQHGFLDKLPLPQNTIYGLYAGVGLTILSILVLWIPSKLYGRLRPTEKVDHESS